MGSQSKGKEGPNYPKIIGLACVGGAIGAGIGVAIHVHPAVVGVGGFLVSLAGLLSGHAVQDSKKGLAAGQVKKATEEAWTAQALGRNDKAEKLLLEALQAAQPLGEQDLLVLTTTHSLANLYLHQRKYDRAEPHYARAVAVYEALGMKDHNAALCYRDRGHVLLALGKGLLGQECLDKALQLLGSKESPELVETLDLQAQGYATEGQKGKALPIYERVKAMHEKLSGASAPATIQTALTVARCRRDLQQLNEALDGYKDVLARINKADRPQRVREAEALLEMAELCLQQDQYKNVEPLSLTALKLLQQYIGPKSPLLQRFFKIYKECQLKQGQALSDNDFLILFGSEAETGKVRDVIRDHTEWVNLKDKSGWSLLQWSCFLGRDENIKWLLRNGCKTDAYDAATVMGGIHVGAAWGKWSSVSAILDGGAPIDSVGPGNQTALMFAAAQGRTETVDQLLGRGANIDAKDTQGRTAMHLAADGGHTEVLTLLLGKGCDKNLREEKCGQTPLHLAALNGHGSTVECLINNQADLFIQDKNGKTAADLAEQSGQNILVQAIRFHEKLAKGLIKG